MYKKKSNKTKTIKKLIINENINKAKATNLIIFNIFNIIFSINNPKTKIDTLIDWDKKELNK